MSRFLEDLQQQAERLAQTYQSIGRDGVYKNVGETNWRQRVHDIFSLSGETTQRRILNKTGSKLNFLVSEKESLDGVVINSIPSDSAQIWRELFFGIRRFSNSLLADLWEGVVPVPPILQRSNGELRVRDNSDETSTVFSRFCGFTMDYYRDRAYSPEKYGIDIKYKPILKQLFEKMLLTHRSFFADLRSEAGVMHGDEHMGNFFIEFIDKEYYKDCISQGFTVNTLPFDSNYFQFGTPESLLENLDSYVFVMRIGDLDQAQDYQEWKQKRKEISSLK